MRDLATNTGSIAHTGAQNYNYNDMSLGSGGGLSIGNTNPTSKLYITDNKIYKTMNNQAKVIVIKVTKFKKSGLIKTSEVINEGWLAKKPNISLELQAIKAFKIPVDDLDNIIIKEVLTVAF